MTSSIGRSASYAFSINTVLPFHRAKGFPNLGGHNLTSVFER